MYTDSIQLHILSIKKFAKFKKEPVKEGRAFTLFQRFFCENGHMNPLAPWRGKGCLTSSTCSFIDPYKKFDGPHISGNVYHKTCNYYTHHFKFFWVSWHTAHTIAVSILRKSIRKLFSGSCLRSIEYNNIFALKKKYIYMLRCQKIIGIA